MLHARVVNTRCASWFVAFLFAMSVPAVGGQPFALDTPPAVKVEPSVVTNQTIDSNPYAEGGLDSITTTSGCTFGDASHCQTYAPILGAYWSGGCLDACLEGYYSFRVADDFVASECGTITSVCVFGEFVQQALGFPDCSDGNPPEEFWVTIYDQVAGLPSEPGHRIHATVLTKTLVGTHDGRKQFQWELDLGSGVPVSAGLTYWLEVRNYTDSFLTGEGCDWFWVQATPLTEGNGLFLQDTGQTYTVGEIQTGADLAFCLNIENEPPATSIHPCCTCPDRTPPSDPLCAMRSLDDCRTVSGDWQIDTVDCSSASCRTDADAGDSCANAIVLPDLGVYPLNNFCSTTDGPTTTTCTGSEQVGRDVWFKWDGQPCSPNVLFELCGFDDSFDTVLTVYHDFSNPTVCVCPIDSSLEIACSNDDCGIAQSTSSLQVGAGRGCYIIRVSGYHGHEGYGELSVSFAPPDSTPLLPIQSPDQTRYLSFSIPGDNIPIALQVELVSLMHPDPPNLPQSPPPDFSALEGQFRWVGPPSDCVESDALHTTFKCAHLQADPLYLNWGTVLQGQPLQVTGAEIVPSSVYDIRTYLDTCEGNESTCFDVSCPVRLRTSRWGDVRSAYQAPSPAPLTQPNVSDVAATVDKFKGLSTALPVSRTDVAPSIPDGRVNITDVAAVVDAFKNRAYPYAATASKP